MRRAGLWLIAIGFLAGAWAGVAEEAAVRWAWYVPAWCLGGAGVVLARRGARQHAHDAVRVQANLKDLAASLEQIAGAIRELDARKEALDPYALHLWIDARFPEPLATFVQARETIAARFGLAAYAEVMDAFAAGERWLNRVWSASVDGYVDEAHASLSRSREHFELAQRTLQRWLAGVAAGRESS